VEFFWILTPCRFVVGYQRFRCLLLPSTLHPVDGGSMDLRNVGILPQNYTRRHNPEDLDLKHYNRT